VAFLYGWVLLLVIQTGAWRRLRLRSLVTSSRWPTCKFVTQCWRQ
jgi:hypothetical protein